MKNEGTIDRIIRVIVGLGLLSLTVFGPQTLWGLIGVIPLLTGLLGVCSAYMLFGFRTCSVSPKSQ